MNKLMRMRIQEVYAALRPSEQKVADWMLEYKGSGGDLLIEGMAVQIQVSQPTIIRFVKALGYKSFKEFKYSLMQEDARKESNMLPESNIDLYGFKLSSKDKLEEIPGKIINTSVKMLEETLKSVQIKEYKRALDAILEAESIVIYSVENSICTATDLMTKLTYLGLNCRMYGDYYLQNVSANNLSKRDLAIGISYSGYSKHTVEMMRNAQKVGAKTMVITNFENAVIADYADILICGSNQQFLYGNTIFSRISQMALVDMIYAGLLNRDYGRLSKRLNKNSQIVAERAYGEDEEIL
ncbi:MAG: MurR/RpiR family transcriptional regulator [Lachnospiraceae bacterium]|nr:MurR/RpiR family transcriptional regulator [Lachnospiraceae bacterium]